MRTKALYMKDIRGWVIGFVVVNGDIKVIFEHENGELDTGIIYNFRMYEWGKA